MNDLLNAMKIEKYIPPGKCGTLIDIFKTIITQYELNDGINKHNLNRKLLFNTAIYECQLKNKEITFYNYYHSDDMNYMIALCKIDKDFNGEKLMVAERVMREQRIKNFTNTGKLLG
jgi:hypothetical protein